MSPSGVPPPPPMMGANVTRSPVHMSIPANKCCMLNKTRLSLRKCLMTGVGCAYLKHLKERDFTFTFT